MDLNELKSLIRVLEESGLSELEIEENGKRVRLQKYGVAPAAAAQSVVPIAPASNPGVVDFASPVQAARSAASAQGGAEELPEGLKTFDAPMVGTFYASPSPGADPFVKVGDKIEPNQTICIVEAMKLMNEVGAKFAGIIERVLVENAQPVEFGQPLFAVRPAE